MYRSSTLPLSIPSCKGRLQRCASWLAAAVLGTVVATSVARAQPEVRFVAATAAHQTATKSYEAIWQRDGDRIVAAFEAITCLPFAEPEVGAIIDDAVSHSGGPNHPMSLRASYGTDVKRSTLVHELGHRHLWQLPERLDDLDGHETLFLILDRVWATVWGDAFAAERVRDESSWRASYDYAAAWQRVRALGLDERARLWNRLLVLNGFAGDCRVQPARSR
jgi:hypothetical protein